MRDSCPKVSDIHPPASELSLRLIQSPEEFSALGASWDALLQQSATNSVFQTSRYLSVWWKHFGAEGDLAVVLAEREGKLVGIAPLQIRRGKTGARRHLRHLCFLGSIGHAEGLLFDFLICRGMEEEVMHAFFSEASPLFELSWDVLYLPFPPTHSPCIDALRQAPGPLQGRLQELVQEESPIIHFQPDWDEFQGTLSRKFRSELRRCTKAMEEKVGAHEITLGVDMSIGELHQHLLAFAAKRWEDSRKDVPAEFVAFERDLLETFHRDGCLEFYGWKRGEEIVCLNCAFVHDNLLWGYQIAWNPEYAKVSPGHVAMASMVRHGHERGYRGLNMLLGGGAYKKAWTESAMELCRLEGFHLRSLKGNLFGAAKYAQQNFKALRGRQAEEPASAGTEPEKAA